MATSTYNLIASQVVGSGGASSITFSSIPNTYTDLKLVISARTNGTGSGYGNSYDVFYLTFNGVGSGYSWINLGDSGSGGTMGAVSGTATAQTSLYFGLVNANGSYGTSNTFCNNELYIPNYTSSNYKSVSADSVMEQNASWSPAALFAGLWSNTAAINSITITLDANALVQYSTFYLYGIRNS
jgi:hypothetical protein